MRLLHFHFINQSRPMKGARAKRDVCSGSSVNTGAKFPVVDACGFDVNSLLTATSVLLISM